MIHTDTHTTPSGIIRETWQAFDGPALYNPESGKVEGYVIGTAYRYTLAGSKVGAVDYTPTGNRKGDIVVRAYSGAVMARLYNAAHAYVSMILRGGIVVRPSSWCDVRYNATSGALNVLHKQTGWQVVSLYGVPRRHCFRILSGAVKAKSTQQPSVGATVHAYKKAALAAQR